MSAKSITASLRQLLLPAAAFVVLLGIAVAANHQRAGVQPDSATPDSPAHVTDAGKKAIHLEVEPARMDTLGGALHTSGTVSLPTENSVKVAPSLQGRVVKVLVRIGDAVRAGQTLALLDSVDAANFVNAELQGEEKVRLARSTLDRQERLYRLGTPDVAAAVAGLDQARQQQAYAKQSLAQQTEQAKIGGFTQKPLADAQSAVVVARTALQQAQSDFTLSQKELDRTRSLKDLGLATDRDLVNAQNAFDKSKAGEEGARESLELAQESLDRERKAFKTGLYANQQLEAARNTVRQADLGVASAEKTLRLAKAQVLRDLLQARSDARNAQLDLQNARRVLSIHRISGHSTEVPITTPISGKVVERNVNPGQVVDTSTLTPWQMFTISNSDRVWIDADVYEKDIASIRLGQPVAVRITSLPNRQFDGHVTYLSPDLNTATRTFKVRTEIPNPQDLLKPGMYADVTLAKSRGGGRLVVPVSAVQIDGDVDFVMVKGPDGNYRKRIVHLGPETNGKYVIQTGLEAGELVVTHGALFLTNSYAGD